MPMANTKKQGQISHLHNQVEEDVPEDVNVVDKNYLY